MAEENIAITPKTNLYMKKISVPGTKTIPSQQLAVFD
jgi:hypothetical protein